MNFIFTSCPSLPLVRNPASSNHVSHHPLSPPRPPPPPPPPPTAITMKGKPYVNKGEPIHLSCDATGVRHIPEFIFWFKDGIEVTPHGRNRNSRVAVTSFRSTEQQALHSELIINHSSLQDKGTYICRSSDGVSDSLIVNILVGKSLLLILSIPRSG